MITNNKGMFSSNSDCWETPQDLFDELNNHFDFTLDAAATDENHKCNRYYTEQNSGLTQPWDGRVFLNSPYGRVISQWADKACEEYQMNSNCELIMILCPARTDTRWFQKLMKHARKICFIKGRLKFINRTLPSYREDGDFKSSPAPFPSSLIYLNKDNSPTTITTMSVLMKYGRVY